MQSKRSVTLTLLALVLFVACASKPAEPAAAQKASPKAITAADLARLRWIEGSWRGTGDIDKPFYERYKFENDTTLVVESFPDEKFDKADDVSKFELKNGEFGTSADGSGSVATAFDDNSITFGPLGKARNTYKWQRETADSWKAVLSWRETPGGPLKERVYLMNRVKL